MGVGLWAARRIFESATEGQTYAFPAYIGADGGASLTGHRATVNKWDKGPRFNHTSHDFRHHAGPPSEYRLPEELVPEIGGWAKGVRGQQGLWRWAPSEHSSQHLQAAFGES